AWEPRAPISIATSAAVKLGASLMSSPTMPTLLSLLSPAMIAKPIAFSRHRFRSEDNTHLVRPCVVTQRHDLIGHRNSIHFHQSDTAGAVVGILDCDAIKGVPMTVRSEEHTSELQSLAYLVCRL